MIYKYSLVIIILSLIFTGCKSNETTQPEKINTGGTDFSTYVALGNSITAGYQSGGLYESAQMYSYGNLIAGQVNTKFEQPLFSDPGTPGRMEYGGLTSTGIPIIKINPSQGSIKNSGYQLPYNNLGVPGAVLYDLIYASSSTTSYAGQHGSSNPLFDMILRNSTLKLGSPIQQAKALKPTFVTLWIGNNDILGYATSGATGIYTPTPVFNELYKALLDSIKGIPNINAVVANIPDVTSIPYFTAVGDKLLQFGRTAFWGITTTGDTTLLTVKNNYLTLRSAISLLNTDGSLSSIGTLKSNPFQNSDVLDSSEVLVVQNIINQYNQIISSLAVSHNFGVVDINSFFKSLKAADQTGGILINGIRLKTEYVTGGLFSLDGVHPSSRAHGLIANEFIKVINSKFNASIPLVNIANIPESIILGKFLPESSKLLPVLKSNSFDNWIFRK